MKKILMATTFIAGSVFALSNANAFTATSGTGSITGASNATVRILTPLAMTETTPMAFGKIQKGTTASTVVLNPLTGAVAAGTGSPTIIGGTTTAGVYNIKGSGDTIKLQVTAGTASGGLTLGTFMGSYDGATTATDYGTTKTGLATDATTGKVFKVGATLSIPAATVGGSYTPGYNVIATYE